MNVDKLVGNTPMIKIDYEYEGKKGNYTLSKRKRKEET